MAIKVTEVIKTRCDPWLNDPDEDDWTHEDRLIYYNDARRIITSARADSRIDIDGTEIQFQDRTRPDVDEMQLDDRWMPVLAHYICAACFADERGDKFDQERSDFHFSRFESLLTLM